MQVYTKNKYMDKLTNELIYQNYHKHSIYTNPIITDSCVYPEEYAVRARDLHQGILSSVEHGYGGRAIEYYEMANKYDLKFVYGVEFYFTFDRFEKDSTNAHMVILAKNENGRKAINRILSEANLTGFYHRGRIDYDLVMSLPENDVWVTTACLGGLWKYDNAKINIHEENLDPKLEKFINMNIALEQHLEFDNIPEMLIVKLHEKFKDNFFLEVQAHQTKAQIEVNKKIVELSKKYNIEIIAGTDSHYINNEDAWKRDYLQKSSGIFMEEESNWFMDYPDGETLFNRFKRQGVLDEDDIKIALANTNVLLEVEEYTSEIFQKTMKMPSAVKYRNMSLDEKQLELIKIVKQSWETFKDTIPVEQHSHYLREIAKELDTVFKIKHADYFLLNYELIKDAVENRGGMITFSGRGSGPSFILNNLLGFTHIDRISSPITLYPERFLSTSRMTAGSLADIDFNCGNTPVFEESQRFVMGGEEHAVPMIAFGTQKPKAAWKMYCRAVDVPFEISNQISAKIDEYETDLKYWDEDSGEEQPNVYDYIPEELREYFDKSKEFLGMIISASRHPCGNILYEGNIKEEFGLIRLKSKGGRETIVACIDGKWCESYLMLKNDLLTVACVKLNYLLYQRVGIPYMSLNQLLEECRQHSEVWKIYEKGYVIGLNQVEKSSTKRKIMKYKPKNISELSALIAGIRPAFKSLIDKLVNREHFEYGIPTLDKLLQTEELPESFILYQEQIMKVLAFAGIPMGDCYTVIKSISKKRFEKIMHYKEQFLTGMSQKLVEAENIDKERADEVSKTIWGIIEDASAYGFNSSHSLSVSFDSLLAAYFKALYPLEFYEVYLNLQMERADKAKAALAKKEAKDAFNIKVLPMRFGQDNRKFTAYPEQNALSNCLKSIKGFGDKIGEEFYKISDRKYDSFLDLLVDIYNIKENKPNKKDYDETKLSGFAVNDTQMEILIKLNYFDQFGKNAKLLKEFKLFSDIYGRKKINKEKPPKDIELDMDILKKYIGKETKSEYKDIDFYGYLKEIFEKIDDKFLSLPEQLKFERELFEIPVYENKELPDTWEYILSFKTYGDKINTPYLITYNLNDGNLTVCQVSSSKLFRDNPFGIYSIIDIKDMQHPFKKKKVGEKKWETTNEKKNVVANYEVIIRDEIAEKEREEDNG